MPRGKIEEYALSRKYNLRDVVFFMHNGNIIEGIITGWLIDTSIEGPNPKSSIMYNEEIKYRVRYKSGQDSWSTTNLASNKIRRQKLELAKEWFVRQGVRGEEILQDALADIREN